MLFKQDQVDRPAPSRVIRLALALRHALDREGLRLIMDRFEDIATVTCTGDLAELARLIEKTVPDVVLVDAVLPAFSAFEHTRLLVHRMPALRIIVIDDVARRAHFRAAEQSGAIGYWTRDASVDQLAEAIRQAAVGQRTFSPHVRGFRSRSTRVLSDGRVVHNDSLDHLTAREMEVLLHLARGLTVKQCAQRMELAASTVENHKSRLMKKLGIHRAVELARLALREGLVA